MCAHTSELIAVPAAKCGHICFVEREAKRLRDYNAITYWLEALDGTGKEAVVLAEGGPDYSYRGEYRHIWHKFDGSPSSSSVLLTVILTVKTWEIKQKWVEDTSPAIII